MTLSPFLLWLLIVSAPFCLAAEIKVLALSGSTRTDSYNKKLALEAAQVARQMGASVDVIDLRDYPMPFYDADLEKQQGMPENARKLRELLISHDALIIASPNYNRSISGVLKNALDWASRGEQGGESLVAFEGKKVAIMSASNSRSGGSKGLSHLSDVINTLRGNVVPIQVSIPFAKNYFSENEHAVDPLLKEEIAELLRLRAAK